MEGKNGGREGRLYIARLFPSHGTAEGRTRGVFWVGIGTLLGSSVLWMGGRYSSEVSRAEGLRLYDGGCGRDLCMGVSGWRFVDLV